MSRPYKLALVLSVVLLGGVLAALFLTTGGPRIEVHYVRHTTNADGHAIVMEVRNYFHAGVGYSLLPEVSTTNGWALMPKGYGSKFVYLGESGYIKARGTSSITLRALEGRSMRVKAFYNPPENPFQRRVDYILEKLKVRGPKNRVTYISSPGMPAPAEGLRKTRNE